MFMLYQSRDRLTPLSDYALTNTANSTTEHTYIYIGAFFKILYLELKKDNEDTQDLYGTLSVRKEELGR